MQAKFAGGVHPDPRKGSTAGVAVVALQPPPVAVIPLQQHLGARCTALVKAGDEVRIGQKIGDAEAYIASPVHASVSGKVKEVSLQPHPAGHPVEAIVVENDGAEAWVDLAPRDPFDMEPGELRQAVREAGIVGLGGAAFPTHVKLAPPKEKPVDTLVLNGAECEPFLTADHRLMVERPDAVVDGARIIARILGVGRVVVGIEANKPDAVEAICRASGGSCTVTALPVMYPQGAEKQLIKALLGREVPPPPGLPLDVGVVVQNVGTAVAIRDALREGRPLVERIVTVAGGGIPRPANLRVRIGTPLAALAEACGGPAPGAAKIVMGGPMMGIAQAGLEAPVVKGTSGLLVFTAAEAASRRERACIRCGRCVRVCPMQLLPQTIALYSAHRLWEKADAIDALACMECGCCSYVCPAAIPLVQRIRLAKGQVLAARRRRDEAERRKAAEKAAATAGAK